MEQNKDKAAWQDFLEESGYNDPSQVETVQTSEVLHDIKMVAMVKRLLWHLNSKHPVKHYIFKLIDAAFRAELGATDTNAYCVAMAADSENPPKRIYINTTDEAKLFPELLEFCKEEIDAAAVSAEKKDKAKRYLSLYMEEWRQGQGAAPQPQQVAPQPQQVAPQPQQMQAGYLPLPDVLNTEKAQQAFSKAIEKGWMRPRPEGGFEWIGFGDTGHTAQLAYLCGKIYGYERAGNVNGNCGNQIPEKALNELFKVTRLYSALVQVYDAQKPQKWRVAIDDFITKL